MIPLLSILLAGFVDETSILTNDGFRLRSAFGRLPTANSVETLLEQAVQPATSSYEESGSFHQIDPNKTSLYGDSPLLTRHTLDGIDITDPYFDGAAGFRIPFLALGGLSIQHMDTATVARNQITYELLEPSDMKQRLQIGGSISGVGDIFPPAIPLMDKFSGTHPRQRLPLPPTERRRLLEHRLVGVAFTTQSRDFVVDHFIEATLGERRFLSFRNVDFRNPTPTAVGTVDEPYGIVTYLLRFRPHDDLFRAYLALEFRQRSNTFAESYFNTLRGSDETAARTSMTLFGGFRMGNFKLGSMLQWVRLSANEPRFTREIADIDGEALRPYYPSGHHLLWHSNVRYDYRASLTRLFIENDTFIDTTLPTRESWSNSLTFQGQPIGRWDWGASHTFQWRQSLRVGVRDTVDGEWWRVAYDAYLHSALSFNGAATNTVSWLDVGTHLTVTVFPTDWLRSYAGFAKTPTEPTAQMARALDSRLIGGRMRTLSGDTIDTMGGKFIGVDDGLLAMPNVLSLFLGLEVKPLKGLAIRGQGFAKQYSQTPWIDYAQGTNAGQSMDGYFFLNPGDKNFILKSATHDPTFTPGVTFQVAASDDDRYFFSVAFTAYVTLGRSAFGNGSTANDPFLVDVSTANPNSVRNGLANAESDRAYVGKLIFGTRIWDTLWLSGTLRYRDGQPFALYEYATRNGQVSTRYETPRGSLYNMDGPREDAHVAMDAKISYTFLAMHAPITVSLVGSNLFDLGNTIQERSTEGATQNRAALETQIPRSLFFNVELGL